MIEKKYNIYINKKIEKNNILKNFMNNNCNIDKLLNKNIIKKTDNDICNVNEIKESESSIGDDTKKKNFNV